MYLDSFCTLKNQTITIPAEQGSRFAKEISNDFNPLHNVDAKRFCVPGDLLFALVLAHYGLSQKMHFNYTGMVGKQIDLKFPPQSDQHFCIQDTSEKTYLEVSRDGNATQDMTFIETFTRAYVAFSGHSFPHILVPLMQQHQVMINPARPMVIYDSMAFEFDTLDIQDTLSLELADTSLEVTGKRGIVTIKFKILSNTTQIGSGQKTMLLSGLTDYDQTKIDGLVALYEDAKTQYLA